MAEERPTGSPASEDELADLVASTDTGGRKPTGTPEKIILGGALLWALFQIWIASPIPFILRFGVFNDTEARSIHLAFAVFLAFLAYPAFKRSPRDYIPIQDWVLAVLAACSAAYLYVFYEAISQRPNNPNAMDIAVAIVGVLLLLEATRRALGPPLMIVAIVFLIYTFGGPHMPGILAWKGASFGAVAYHQWISTEGVFGIALGVSTSFVFLFVLFGALLDKAGAGNYFIKVAFSLLGHFRGGPAKAAVVASAMTGLISGSSIANVVTTGTFTIPMMKRVGFSPEKGGAVEVASSVNGQIMPPVMGAAAFLMVEYVGITYFEVITHAFIPALISYIALVYIVHLEALKADMQGLPKPGERFSTKLVLLGALITFGSYCIVAGVVGLAFEFAMGLGNPTAGAVASLILLALLFVMGTVIQQRAAARGAPWAISIGVLVLFGVGVGAFLLYNVVALVRAAFPEGAAFWVFVVLLLVVYACLVWFGSKQPDLELDDPNSPVVSLPETGPTVKSGLHYVLPVVVLVWCLMVERLSPGLSAFWATALMMIILVTQRPLIAIFRAASDVGLAVKQGFDELIGGLIDGARNMIGIGIATATAGIIVGSVSQTGVGLVLADLVEILSLGNIMLMLVLTAVLSLILGMGLPTTANYIVVSSLLAPVIVTLGQQSGLIVPLIAVHLFVFYFGIMADVTPPVGLASFAAAAVSGGDPIKTGFVAFFYSLRTAALPFLFIFNTDLLLINVGWIEGFFVFIVATAAMLIFAAATQGFWFARNRIYETVLLLLCAFTLFRPGFWMDMISAPYDEQPPDKFVEAIAAAPANADVRVIVAGEDEVGNPKEFFLILPVGEPGDGAARLEAAGLEILQEDGEVIVDGTTFDSPAANAGFDFDQKVLKVLIPRDQLPKQLMYIPALIVLVLIAMMQRRRGRPGEPAPQSAAA